MCAVCGKEIPETRTSNNVKYCSRACLRKAEADRRMDYITRRATRTNRVKGDVLRAYQHRCALCGWQATAELISFNGRVQLAHGNQIHHIIPVAEGGTDADDNLILLCPNHHKQADMGLIPREELQAHTKSLTMTDEEISESMSRCAETISKAIFG